MKKLLLGIGSLILSLSSYGQLADGATAPNFTVNDIYGNTHTLYDYLDAGKVVILDFSATWCGPCWSFHQGHVLKNIHETYGPDGTDEAVVLFIEADGTTSYSDLIGTGSNTLGNWVNGTPYPIINNSSLNSSYAVGSFPTFYVVCPDRKLTHYDQTTEAPNAVTWGDVSSYLVGIGQNCGAGNMDGTFANAALTEFTGESIYCSAGSTVALSAAVTNYGTTSIPSIDVKVMDGTTEIFNSTFNGPMEVFGTYTLDLGTYTANADTDLDIIITTVDGKASDNTLTASITAAPVVANEVGVKITLDQYADEVSWNIKNAIGSVIASKTYSASENSSVQYHAVELPGTGCYTFEIADSYGDGISNGGYQILYNGVTVVNKSGSFGDGTSSLLNQNGSIVSINENSLQANIYPNPAQNELNISTNENISAITIFDLNGKEMMNLKDINRTQATVNTSELTNGFYLIQLKDSKNNTTVQKLHIVK